MKFIITITALLFVLVTSSTSVCDKRVAGSENDQGIDSKSPTVLAIFAHPDDELLTGAALAHFAAQGAKVYVAIATDGALGTTDFAGIPAGPKLTSVRHEEMICSAKALGIEAPIFIGLPDQLNATTGALETQLNILRQEVSALITKLQPDVLITFGPDGWTGHPDHRLTGAVVTEVFASRRWPRNPALYFSGLPTGSITESSWAKYLTVDSTYLTTHVLLEEADYLKLRAAYQCHQSQYRESVRQKLPMFLEKTQKRVALFRPFLGNEASHSAIFPTKTPRH